MSNRIIWLDAVKGVGILLVMMSHFCHIPNVFTVGYMPLFFVAAGLTYKPVTSYRDTITKKGSRLLIPYIVYGLIGLLVASAYDYMSGTLTFGSFSDKIIGLLYMRRSFYWPYDFATQGNLLGPTGATWFLCCLFIAFLILVAYERCKNKNMVLCVIVLLTIVTYKIPYQLPWGGELSLMASLFILTGYKFKETITNTCSFNITRDDQVNAMIESAILCMLTIVLVSYNGFAAMLYRNYGNHGYWSVPVFFFNGIIFTILVVRLCQLCEHLRWIRIFAYLGQQSMRMLCIHMLIMCYSSAVLLRIPYICEWSDYAKAPIFLIEILIFNYILQSFIDRYQYKLKALRWL